MIENITVGNVRLFEGEKGWSFELKPLTVLCGTNSSGKSTILKMPVLLAQSHRTQEDVGLATGRLRCRGGQVDLGNYEALVSSNDQRRHVQVAITCHHYIDPATVSILRSYRAEPFPAAGGPEDPLPLPTTNQKPLAMVSATVKGEFTFCHQLPAAGRKGRKNPLASEEVTTSTKAGYLLRAHFVLRTSEGEELLDWRVEIPRKTPRLLPPYAAYVLRVPSRFCAEDQWLRQCRPLKGEQEGYEDFVVTLQGILPNLIYAQYEARNEADQHTGNEFYSWPLPNDIQAACAQLGLSFSQLHYLGPLRSPPKRHYLTDLEIMPSMDPAGEFLGYVLRDSGEQMATSVMPPHAKGPRQAGQIPVLDALQPWLHYLRTGEAPASDAPLSKEVSVEKASSVVLQFKLRTVSGAGLHALADSGFGYSQVIPILVRCLLARRGSVVLIEQPELHLHPAVQIRLARFFTEMTAIGKQIIIESHSEHLVNAIRVLSAEDESGRLAALCKIIFIDAEAGEKPKVHDLSVQPDGMVPRWPRTFFGEGITLSTRLLKAQRRYLSAKRAGERPAARPEKR